MAQNRIIDMTARMLVDNKGFKAGLDQSNKYLKGFQSQISNLKNVVAGAFAIGAVANFSMEAAKLAGEFEGVKNAFDKLNQPNLLENLRKATRGTVSDLDLMKTAVKAQNFKIPLEQLATYLEFAQKRASQTGESVDYLVDSIITGIGRKSPMILDNLGISASALADEVKKVGDFGTATGNIIEEELTKMGDVALTAKDKQEQLAASTANLKTAWGTIVNELGNYVLPVLSEYAMKLADVFTTSEEMRKRAQQASWSEVVKTSISEVTEEAQRYVEKGLYPIEEATTKAAKAIITQWEALKKWNTATEDQIKQYDEIINAIKEQYGLVEKVTVAEEKEIVTLETLDKQIAELNEQKKNANIEDTKSIGIINDKIKALDDQKKKINELTDVVINYGDKIEKLEPVAIPPIDVKPITEGLQEMGKVIQTTEEEMAGFQISTEQLTTTLVDTMGQMVAGLITGEMETNEIMGGLMKSFGDFLIQMGEAIAAYGIAAQAFQIAIENPITAILAGAALVAAGYVVQYYASEGMADGGIVPAGYPNDSYPAMLTTGETVVPAKRLPDFSGNNNITVQVTGIQKGEDIHYILQKAEKRLNRLK